MKVICPIRAVRGSSDLDIAPECMGEKCAWYVGGACAVVCMAESHRDVVLALQDLKNEESAPSADTAVAAAVRQQDSTNQA